jgi:DHA1 family bicyclomycin/chloramphenicol resistance-like MFS transporter
MLLVLGISSTDIFISSLPAIAKHYQVSIDVVTMTLSAATAGVAIGSLLAAMFSDRFGRRATLLWSNGAYIIFSFLIGYTDNIWVMIALRFLQMGSVSFNFVLSRQIIKDKFPIREQVSANSIMASGAVLSPALAPTVGAYIALWFGWKYCFYFSSLFGIALWLYLYFKFEESLPAAKKLTSLPTPWQFAAKYFSLFKSRAFLGFVLQYGFGYASFFAFISISSFVYINVLKVSPTAYTWVYLLLAIAYLVGNSINQMMNKRDYNIDKIIYTGMALTFVGALLLNAHAIFKTHTEIIVILTIAIFIMRAGLGIMNSPVQIRLLNIHQDKSGEAVGMLFFVQFVFSSMSCAWVSSFGDDVITALIVVSSILTVLMFPAYWLAVRTKNSNLIKGDEK